MSARILVVEDEEALTTLLRYNLDAEGYDVETVGRGDDADTRRERTDSRSDRAALDATRTLRHRTGAAVCGHGWQRKQLPIIMLPRAARKRAGERPCEPRRRLHRRSCSRCRSCWRGSAACCACASPERLATVLTYGDIELDREKRRVARSGRPVDPGSTRAPGPAPKTSLEHPGRAFSREQLLDSVRGRDIYIDERTVDVHIGRLGSCSIRPGAGSHRQLRARRGRRARRSLREGGI